MKAVAHETCSPAEEVIVVQPAEDKVLKVDTIDGVIVVSGVELFGMGIRDYRAITAFGTLEPLERHFPADEKGRRRPSPDDQAIYARAVHTTVSGQIFDYSVFSFWEEDVSASPQAGGLRAVE